MTQDFFIQLLAAIQSGVSIYILLYLIRSKAILKEIIYFSFIVFTFVALKNELIDLGDYTKINGLAWAVYNVMIYSYIYRIIKNNGYNKLATS